MAFPAYITYSLPGRIAPRAAAAAALGGRPLALAQLALGDEAFARWLRVPPEAYAEWLAGWRTTGAAARWAELESGSDRTPVPAGERAAVDGEPA